MRQLKRKTVLLAKRIQSKLKRKTHKSHFIHQDIPYFSQWESRELVEKIIMKQIEAKDDPRWRKSGAQDVEEYASWSWSGCGMACLKMILAHKNNEIIPLVTLGRQCLNYGGYTLPLEDGPGLYYKPFVRFIKEKYGLDGKAMSALTLSEIKQAISDGGYVMTSVTPEIRFPVSTPKKRGGHLVLLFGYDDTKQVVYLNNPSGFKNSQEKVEVSYEQFMKFFDNKGIIVRG
jgi:uncharacterized protein YvpB